MSWKKTLSATLTLGIFLFAAAHAERITVGKGAYTTDLPPGQNVPINGQNNPAIPKTVTGFNKPAVSNKWWSSLIWQYEANNPWSQNMFPMPLAYQAQTNGLGLGYLNRYFVSPAVTQSRRQRTREYHYTYSQDVVVGLNGVRFPDTKVQDYSDWSVTAIWSANNQSLQATLVDGSPFVYFTKTGGNANLTFAANPTVWYNQNGVLGLTVNGRYYGVFAPSGSTWTGTNTLQSTLNGKNYFSVAVLPDNTAQTLEYFRRHAYAFVTSTSVAWAYDEASANLKTTYTLQSELKEQGSNNINKPLVALRRHQWLNSQDPTTSYTYVSPRGTLKVIEASQFTTNMAFNGVLPILPNFAKDGVDTYSAARLYQYVDTIYKQTPTQRWNGITTGDTYWVGKAFGKISQLLKIADQVNHTQAKALFLAEIKTRLQDWFDGNNPQLFYYNKNWNTLIGYPASYGSETNLNDHHFHYGYYIQAAATVAQFDADWVKSANYGGMVEMLLKDVSNWDRTDTRFPFLRYFDVFEGHCWANGPALFASQNNQESSSESMNYSSGLILWGAMTNNKTLRDLGIYLYTTESEAIKQYWFDVDNQVFPQDFALSNIGEIPTLGMVWGDGGAYTIFWEGTAEEIHGINFLPVTAGSLYLGHYPDYLKLNQAFMYANAGGSGTWRDIHMSVKALYDPAAAITEFNNNEGYTPEAGESKAHTYHWIHNINQMGNVDPAVTASVPTYGVFNKNNKRTYVAYNPTGAQVTVRFSDGATLAVPANSMATSGQTTTPPQTVTFTQDVNDLKDGQAYFWLKADKTLSAVALRYTLNGSSAQTINLTFDGSVWSGQVSGLTDNANIAYRFIYTYQGTQTTTDQFQHQYQLPDSGNPTTNDFYQIPQQMGNGMVKLNLIPRDTSASDVSVSYKINGGVSQTAALTNDNGNWSVVINGLDSNATIDYTFSFKVQGVAVNTAQFSYQYVGCGIATTTDDYTQKVDLMANARVLVSFITKKGASIVDVHYKINNGGQQDLRMTQSGDTFTYIISNLKNGDMIDYYFTYGSRSYAIDSPRYKYTYVSQ